MVDPLHLCNTAQGLLKELKKICFPEKLYFWEFSFFLLFKIPFKTNPETAQTLNVQSISANAQILE